MEVIIIGNGVTGISAAVTIRKLNPTCTITIISSESKHFYSRTALMYLYMGHMQYTHIKPYEDWFWVDQKLHLLQAKVINIEFENQAVILAENSRLNYDKLLIATGSCPNPLNLPNENLAGIQGFYNLEDLDLIEKNSKYVKQAVIVGGGLIGIELAEMLHTRCLPVTFLVREDFYWGNILPESEAKIIQDHIREHPIDLRLGTRVKEILSDKEQRVKGIITDKGETINCDLLLVAIGVRPNIPFLKNTALETDLGVLVNKYLETNIPNVFAAGDCAQFRSEKPNRKNVEQLWYTGRMQGETVANTICGQPKAYERGIWFNSAKFFDIEYQTYGFVPARPVDGEETLVWQHPKNKKLLRINYLADSQAVVGFNLLGIRYRHDVCARWIEEKRDIRYVLKHLPEANFDPEFSRRYEKEIIRQFNQQLTALIP
jgi:NADPH-dependent 2,4-dienoyl-CoA reductase/sulfur reductase-like enzyme